GLTSSSFEMASKGGAGVELDLDKVPCREDDMTPYEMMLSESQERMLIVLKPGMEALARGIFEKWDLDFAIIGRLTDSGRMVLRMHGETVGELPIDPLAQASPEYERPWSKSPARPAIDPWDIPPPEDPLAVLAKLLATPDLCSKRWVWEQYDHMVMADTVQRPGGDAAVVRVHGTNRALAATVDCTPRYCLADPERGGAQAVAESWRNLTAVGARPLAITDNMNFGNPERPEIMGQFVGCIEGMRKACDALAYPVVSGNVSLYNETNGQAVLPTPVIGGVGLIEDVHKTVSLAFKAPGEAIILIGTTRGHLGASLYLRDVLGRAEGAPPPVDLAAERRNGDFVRGLIARGLVTACHDLSDGGLLVALAEMALASGGPGGNGKATIGAEIEVPGADPKGARAAGIAPLHGWLFGEDQARYSLTVTDPEPVLAAAAEAGVPAVRIGWTGDAALTLSTGHTISLADLQAAHEGWLPGYMAATT
ncbi:MAG: AIR synthase-related protein, partial [Kiloniellales bacterium]